MHVYMSNAIEPLFMPWMVTKPLYFLQSFLPSPLPRLTSGLENTLLHYVALHPGRGVMVCPTHATPPGPVHAELVQSFRQTSVAVREVLRGRVEGERPDEEEEADEYDSESDEEQGTTVGFPSSS